MILPSSFTSKNLVVAGAAFAGMLWVSGLFRTSARFASQDPSHSHPLSLILKPPTSIPPRLRAQPYYRLGLWRLALWPSQEDLTLGSEFATSLFLMPRCSRDPSPQLHAAHQPSSAP